MDIDRWNTESPKGGSPRLMFRDPGLQARYERSLSEAADPWNELREVRALVALYDWLEMLEGPHSPRVHDAREHLLSPRLRPLLEKWLRRPAASAATSLREALLRSIEEQHISSAP